MAKKKEDIEEIEDIDEIEDVEEIDDEIIDDDVVEDEKPAKKSAKKSGKKKMSKGAKITTIVVSVVAVLAIIVVLTVYVIIPALGGSSTPTDAAAAYSGTFGNVKPTTAGSTAVTTRMNSFEMMQAALKNYEEADYAASICFNGGVATKIGPIAVNQDVNSLKVRVGTQAASDTGYFCYSKSMGLANMWEEYYTTGNGTIKYRKADAGVEKNSNGQRAIANSWKDTVTYANLDDFKAATSTDFTKIWSYEKTDDISSFTSETATKKPSYDKEQGCYFFTIAMDTNNEEAFASYIEVMKYQLSGNMNMKVESLTFTRLEFEFAVWDNGQIRYLFIHEAYTMNLSKVPVINKLNNMVIENNCMNEYSFDANEKIPYDMGVKKDTTKTPLDFNGLVELF